MCYKHRHHESFWSIRTVSGFTMARCGQPLVLSLSSFISITAFRSTICTITSRCFVFIGQLPMVHRPRTGFAEISDDIRGCAVQNLRPLYYMVEICLAKLHIVSGPLCLMTALLKKLLNRLKTLTSNARFFCYRRRKRSMPWRRNL